MTQIYAERTVANSSLNFLEYSQTRFKEFYTKIYIDKISLLHDTMTRYKPPQLDDVIKELPNNTSKSYITLERESNKSMRSLMIAKDKNTGGVDTILQHDLSNNSALFDGDLMTKVNNKSQLISELEN